MKKLLLLITICISLFSFGQIYQNDTTICAGDSILISILSTNDCGSHDPSLDLGLSGWYPLCSNADWFLYWYDLGSFRSQFSLDYSFSNSLLFADAFSPQCIKNKFLCGGALYMDTFFGEYRYVRKRMFCKVCNSS